MHVRVRMNNSRHAMLPADTPDSRWKIHTNRAGKGLTVDRRREGGTCEKTTTEPFSKGTSWLPQAWMWCLKPPFLTCHWAESDQPVWRAGRGGASALWLPLDWRTPHIGSRFRGGPRGRTHWRCEPPHPWRSCPCWWWCNSSAGRLWTPGWPGLGCLTERQKRERCEAGWVRG